MVLTLEWEILEMAGTLLCHHDCHWSEDRVGGGMQLYASSPSSFVGRDSAFNSEVAKLVDSTT